MIISEFGNDPIDALENHYRVEEFESPDPATLGPDDVLIKIKACAVSWVRKRQRMTSVSFIFGYGHEALSRLVLSYFLPAIFNLR